MGARHLLDAGRARERIDGRLALRYLRRLNHPVERVWLAVSQPAGLGCWFPCRVEGDVRVGGRLRCVFPADNTEVAEPSEGEGSVVGEWNG